MKIAQYLIMNMRPFSTSENRAFRALIHECEPRYKFPARATFSDTIIPRLYEVCAQQLKSELKDVSVAWTCDSWTSRATESYITITCHYINKNFELCARVLQTRVLRESHTGVNTAHVLNEAANEWKCLVESLTTDNASNMKVAAAEANIPLHIGCFSHTLNLASNKATDIRQTNQILSKMRVVVSYIHRSTVATAVLAQKQVLPKVPSHKLLDVKTRWNSSYETTKRFLEQTVPIHAMLCDEKIKRQKETNIMNTLSSEDMQHTEQFVQLLEPMYTATQAMGEEKKPTASLILPLLQKLRKTYTEQEDDNSFQKAIKKAILDNLAGRYTEQKLVEQLEVITALDPRVKNYFKPGDGVWQRLAQRAAEKAENAEKVNLQFINT